MARIRTIKPEFWTSEQVMECSPITRLLFVGLWNFCDDNGIHSGSLKTIKAEVFPCDDIGLEDIRRMVGELSSNGLLHLYRVKGKRFLRVTGWSAHQKIDKPNPKHPMPDTSNAEDGWADENDPLSPYSGDPHLRRHSSLQGTPTNGSDDEREPFQESDQTPEFENHSTNVRRTVDDASPPEGKGRESKGMDSKSIVSSGDETAEEKPPPGSTKKPESDYSPEFERIWQGRPRREGTDSKRKASQACNARRKEGYTWEQMSDGLLRYKAFVEAKGKLGTEFVMMASTFFGPDRHFLEPWTFTPPPPPSGSAAAKEAKRKEQVERFANRETQNQVYDGECSHA